MEDNVQIIEAICIKWRWSTERETAPREHPMHAHGIIIETTIYGYSYLWL